MDINCYDLSHTVKKILTEEGGNWGLRKKIFKFFVLYKSRGEVNMSQYLLPKKNKRQYLRRRDQKYSTTW